MTKPIQLNHEDWLEIGLQPLSSSGEQTLTLERLCRMASRTKGFSYHHFKNYDNFIDAPLKGLPKKSLPQASFFLTRTCD